MKIRMLTTAPGSVDGFRVSVYEVMHVYDLTASAGARDLAAAFVGAELAEEVRDDSNQDAPTSQGAESTESGTAGSEGSEGQPAGEDPAAAVEQQNAQGAEQAAAAAASKPTRGARAKQN